MFDSDQDSWTYYFLLLSLVFVVGSIGVVVLWKKGWVVLDWLKGLLPDSRSRRPGAFDSHVGSILSELKREVRELQARVDRLERARPQVEREILERPSLPEASHQAPVRDHYTPPLPEASSPIARPNPRPSLEPHGVYFGDRQPPRMSPLVIYTELYNEVLDAPERRREFWDAYKVVRFGTVNAQERRVNPELAPRFETSDAGDFLAVHLEDAPSQEFAVVPRFDLALTSAGFTASAIAVAFRCPSLDGAGRHAKPRVVTPALFERVADSEWRLKRRGELGFGQGEVNAQW